MKHDRLATITFDDHVNCYGHFEVQDAVCLSHCALRLRCCIERKENLRMEILEDLADTDAMVVTTH
jgi:hypothetical protein